MIINGKIEKMLFRDEGTAYSSFAVSTQEESVPKSRYGTVLCVGTIPNLVQIPIRIEGDWDANKNCFTVTSIRENIATDEDAIALLEQADGVGRVTAQKIIELMGLDLFYWSRFSFSVMKLSKNIAQITEERGNKICEFLKSIVAKRTLFELLPANAGVAIDKMLKDMGSAAAEMLKLSPYIIGEKYGISFLACERIAAMQGIPDWHNDRMRRALKEVLKMEQTGGNVFSYVDAVADGMKRLLHNQYYSEPVSMAIILKAITEGKNIVVEQGPPCRIYDREMLRAEDNVATQIVRLERTARKLPLTEKLVEEASEGTRYSVEQKEAFELLKKTGVCVLTGGPGTGKTTVLNGLIKAYKTMCPQKTVRLCSPTGRAAQRMSEATGMESVTIHRLLEYRPFGESISHKDAESPIDADFIVMDEASMVNIEVASLFFSAVKSGSLVLIVGDINQLSSVGAGDVLHDLLASKKIRTVELTSIFRQSADSGIVRNSSLMMQGQMIANTGDCQLEKHIDASAVKDAVVAAAIKLHDKNNPFATQILSPVHKGDAGVKELNKALQEALNPRKDNLPELHFGNRLFRVGDPIVMKSNNYDIGYYNGDLGIIRRIEDGSIIATVLGSELTLPREVHSDIDLAYALTVHKAQGSEFETVLVSLPSCPLLRRNLLYTAVTRAKNKVIIYAEANAIEKAVKTRETGTRNTSLADKIIKNMEDKR